MPSLRASTETVTLWSSAWPCPGAQACRGPRQREQDAEASHVRPGRLL